MRTAIYARVSSAIGNRQNTERQVVDLIKYANEHGMEISKVFEEKISGSSKNCERVILNECLDFCVKME